ncbi:hypothetical protein [Sulfuriroseicoccus oceanibius]|uniref:Uncharacterized protein n=1 Tax=Sulfuriroseicoccus oceanibius TaxID=2707525 RepID=A0A6B3L4Y2_9BACT|nr:hypothetical protein [Sulfuriroseicoccus oceanibius]QQL43874.1 hypothetical protein G3M56_008180 [Sulfuriroseicoccus oceanibius]
MKIVLPVAIAIVLTLGGIVSAFAGEHTIKFPVSGIELQSPTPTRVSTETKGGAVLETATYWTGDGKWDKFVAIKVFNGPAINEKPEDASKLHDLMLEHKLGRGGYTKGSIKTHKRTVQMSGFNTIKSFYLPKTKPGRYVTVAMRALEGICIEVTVVCPRFRQPHFAQKISSEIKLPR